MKKRVLSIVLCAVMILTMLPVFSVESAAFSPRLSAPSKSGYYASYSRNNCVAYARCRANEILGRTVNWASGNGGIGFWNTSGFAHGNTPKVGAIACWDKHVAIVESVNGSNIVLSEAHYSYQPTSSSYKNVVINGGGGSAGTWFDNYYGTVNANGRPSECSGPSYTWYGYVYLIDDISGNPPTGAWIKSNKTNNILVNEQVTFDFGANDATKYVIGIYKDSKEFAIIDNGSNKQYITSFSEPGNYHIHVACYNQFGHTDSNYIYFTVNEKMFKVSYMSNGGSGAPSSQTKIKGTDLILSSTKPTREGYTFLGWSTSANASKAQYLPGGTYTKDADITLYAVWIKNSNARIGLKIPNNVSVGQQIQIPVVLSGEAIGGISFTLKYDETKLKYIACTDSAFMYYEVNNKASGKITIAAVDPGSVQIGTVFVLTFETIFPSFATELSLSVNDAVSDDSKGISIPDSSWILKINSGHSVTYDSNGGSGAPSSQTKINGTDLVLSSIKPTREGYTFLGWATSASASTAQYSAGGTYTKDEDVTLYAVWEKNPPTVLSISIASLPSKTVYTVGEIFVTYGLSIKVNMSDGTSKIVTSGYTFYAPYMSTAGTKTVTISYGGKTTSFEIKIIEEKISMYRLYNPNSGEHFYTADENEKNNLVSVGWKYEGIGWTAPKTSDKPVYRLYNQNGGEHHYTLDASERDFLVSVGWKYEGIGWYSDEAEGVPIYRQYNPNAFANNHNYTANKSENDWLVSLGWKAEGIGWYGVA